MPPHTHNIKTSAGPELVWRCQGLGLAFKVAQGLVAGSKRSSSAHRAKMAWADWAAAAHS